MGRTESPLCVDQDLLDVLHAMYMDKTNYVYRTFLKSILSKVQVAVKSFEGKHTDPVKLLDNLVIINFQQTSQPYGKD